MPTRQPITILAHWLLLVAFCWGRLPAVALAATPPSDNSLILLQGKIKQSDYRLGAGDRVTIEDATMGALVQNGHILTDGSISLPLVGRISLNGLTIAEAKKRLNEHYAHYYVNPGITLQLSGQRPARVYITGGVAHAGVYVSGKNMTPSRLNEVTLGNYSNLSWYSRLYLTDALMMAGGLNPNADARDIRIRRTQPEATTLHVNLLDLLASESTAPDIPLRDQDVIEVPELPENLLIKNADWDTLAQSNITQQTFKVSVMGAVNQPGSFPVKAQDTVLTAVAKAGGFSPLASQSHVFILRSTATGQVLKHQLNLTDKTLIGKTPLPQWGALQPNDVIFVDDALHKKASQFGFGVLDRSATAALFPIFNHLFSRD